MKSKAHAQYRDQINNPHSWLLFCLLFISTVFLVIILHHNDSSVQEKFATQKQTYLPFRPLFLPLPLPFPLPLLRRTLWLGLNSKETVQPSLLFTIQVFLELLCSFSDTFLAGYTQ